MARFTDKVAIITGGAQGIGAATARRFAAEGAQVIIADIQDEAGEAAAAEIRGAGGAALYRRCDVASGADWQALSDLALRQFGRLDIVHNNAYTATVAPTHELDESAWDQQIAVCLKAVFLSVKACMPHLLAAGGVMINTSSIQALLGFPESAAYGSAKGGISALTRALAVEYGPRVRVNAVLPGAILTPTWDPAAAARVAPRVPARRLGRPEEIAAAVCFLASDDASYIMGTSLVVDGGWSIAKE